MLRLDSIFGHVDHAMTAPVVSFFPPVGLPLPPQFPFLRTYKPMLKRARGTPSYEDIRLLLRLWLHCKHIRRLLDSQNERLYLATRGLDKAYEPRK